MTWQGQSFYDYVSEHLGYCFSVSSIKFQIKHGLRKKLQLLLEIKNEGFGVCFQETEAEAYHRVKFREAGYNGAG